MLVLTRRIEESVIVDGFSTPERALKVTVLEIKGGSVRLGFQVDKDIPVHRLEVWERIRAGIPQAPRRARRQESVQFRHRGSGSS